MVPSDGRFGNLRFGDSISCASSVGRPSKVSWIENNYCSLLYSQAGFQLEFEDGFLVYFALFANRPVDVSEISDDFNPTVIHLQLTEGKNARLSKESRRGDIEELFGEPTSMDFGSDETILYYNFPNLTVEFELQAEDGFLMRMSVFPSAS